MVQKSKTRTVNERRTRKHLTRTVDPSTRTKLADVAARMRLSEGEVLDLAVAAYARSIEERAHEDAQRSPSPDAPARAA